MIDLKIMSVFLAMREVFTPTPDYAQRKEKTWMVPPIFCFNFEYCHSLFMCYLPDTSTECILRASHCCEHFTNMNSFMFPDNPTRHVPLSSLFLLQRQRNWGHREVKEVVQGYTAKERWR